MYKCKVKISTGKLLYIFFLEKFSFVPIRDSNKKLGYTVNNKTKRFAVTTASSVELMLRYSDIMRLNTYMLV